MEILNLFADWQIFGDDGTGDIDPKEIITSRLEGSPFQSLEFNIVQGNGGFYYVNFTVSVECDRSKGYTVWLDEMEGLLNEFLGDKDVSIRWVEPK